MEIMTYFQALSLWAIIPIGVLGGLLFVAFGPRDLVHSTFHGDSIETVWSFAPVALLGIGAAVFATLRLMDFLMTPVVNSFRVQVINSETVGVAVSDVVPMQITSVIVDSDGTTVKSATHTYHFKAQIGISAREAYVGRAYGETWVCFNKEYLYTKNCNLPQRIEHGK